MKHYIQKGVLVALLIALIAPITPVFAKTVAQPKKTVVKKVIKKKVVAKKTKKKVVKRKEKLNLNPPLIDPMNPPGGR